VRYYTLGVRQGASVSWLYGDHLGSTSASSGAAATSERYYAYGKDRGTGNLPTDHRFTGQISDASGLIFMNARYYDPVLGSFLSPDTLVPEPGQPEGYNRYAYANGNPLRFIDPSGHASCAAGDNACWQQEWQWNNRWYEAHGYFWNGGTSHWSNTGRARFADEEILDQTVAEAGIAWDSMPEDEAWTFGRKAKVATGIVAFGRRLASGSANGLARLAVLVGGRATMSIMFGGNLLCRGGAVPCTLPTWNNSIAWPSAFIDEQSTEFVAATAVHELGHVIDWQSGQRFSTNWEAGHHGALTSYSQCTMDCVQRWESWSEAVTTYVYGSDYPNVLSPLGPAIPNARPGEIALQINQVEALLQGWIRP
jgi:RHS repeat-associated protein